MTYGGTEAVRNFIDWKRALLLIFAALLLAGLGIYFGPRPLDTSSKPFAGLVDNLGDYHYAIATKSPEAQRFFDQGLRLTYGYSYEAATASFKEAARLDPTSPMPQWGIALAASPNLNSRYSGERDDRSGAGARAIARAASLVRGQDSKEADLIRAMQSRYASLATRAHRDGSYLKSMCVLMGRYPDDLDIATLCAQAHMIRTPWLYWAADNKPMPGILEAKEILEQVMNRSPDHPFANHLYVHLMEASAFPEQAMVQARRLEHIMPGAGHMIHMPAHIYLRVGMFAEVIQRNELSIAADAELLRQWSANGGPHLHLGHVMHANAFLIPAATESGRYAYAKQAADTLVSRLNSHQVHATPWLQEHYVKPWLVERRFGKWDDVLKIGRPPEDLAYPTGIWHYVRGSALLRKKDLAQAQDALEGLNKAASRLASENLVISMNGGAVLLRIAAGILKGEIAAARGNTREAVAELTTAAQRVDSLKYIEPPPWDQSPRLVLGRILLDAGRAAEAEEVYREDLRRNPNNGWSLYGLAQSLGAQSKMDARAETMALFAKAWRDADTELSASAF